MWAMVDNFSKECSRNVQSEILLSKTSTRRKLIESLMDEAKTYGFDGFNLDFESMKPEALPHYVQFIRELSVSCRRKGLSSLLTTTCLLPTQRAITEKSRALWQTM